MAGSLPENGHYAEINGLKLYYEMHGKGSPLVLLHGGGSTIASNFGRILPDLAQKRRVIAIESQSHGHTPDIDRPTSFEQDADDVAALLGHLHLSKASIMGFSNGATTALQLAIRHPLLTDRLILASGLFKRQGMPEGFFEGMKEARPEHMPAPLQEAYLNANPDKAGLSAMFHRDSNRMIHFEDIADSNIRSIKAPTLIINGDKDVVKPEHALELYRLLPSARLVILPAGHGDYIGEICSPVQDRKTHVFVVELIERFLTAN